MQEVYVLGWNIFPSCSTETIIRMIAYRLNIRFINNPIKQQIVIQSKYILELQNKRLRMFILLSCYIARS